MERSSFKSLTMAEPTNTMFPKLSPTIQKGNTFTVKHAQFFCRPGASCTLKSDVSEEEFLGTNHNYMNEDRSLMSRPIY